jgi:hypothetical protein
VPGLLAVAGTAAMVGIVLWTHEIARIVGPLWVAAWIVYYAWYRRRVGRPILGSVARPWDQEQLAILAETGEWELHERLRIALERRNRLGEGGPGHAGAATRG